MCGYLEAIATYIFEVNNPNIEGAMVQYIAGVNNQLQCLHFSEARYAMRCLVEVPIFRNLAENRQFWGVYEDS